MLRDTYLLNKPPTNLGNGYQGFDIRYAVTVADGIYSKEQGNYGKLTRIWKEGFDYRPVETAELLDTEREYLLFQKEIVLKGFEILAKRQLRQLGTGTIDPLMYDDQDLGYLLDRSAYAMNVRKNQALRIAAYYRLSNLVVMTEKYKCTVYKDQDGDIEEIAKNEKRSDKAESENLRTAKKLAKLQKDKEKCETERFFNVDRFMAGELEKDNYQRIRTELMRKAELLDKQIAEASAKLHESEAAADDGVRDALDTLKRYSGADELSREIVEAFIDKILIYDPGAYRDPVEVFG